MRHHCAHQFDSLCLAALLCHAISTGPALLMPSSTPRTNCRISRGRAPRQKNSIPSASRRWRWGPRCWPHAWLPWARAWALLKGTIRLRYVRHNLKTASGMCTPRFSIVAWPRDGKAHASRAPNALEACSMKPASYLMLHRDGNNHLYGGAKKHRGVMPLLSVAPSTCALTPTGVPRHHPIEI